MDAVMNVPLSGPAQPGRIAGRDLPKVHLSNLSAVGGCALGEDPFGQRGFD